MRRLLEVFRLELLSLVRSRTLLMLAVASLAWMLAVPSLVKGDGTAAGARELYVHFSLGGVFLLLVISLLASATGSVARERVSRRLQLTLVRPVSGLAVTVGKIAAHVAVGAAVLVLAAVALAFRVDLSAPCNRVLSPVLPSPQEEARQMYDVYMSNPETPAEVRKAKKSTVLRLLTQRAVDHYDTVQTNAVTRWTFPVAEAAEGVAVRMRFTNPMEMRQDVIGTFRFADRTASISNITQAVLTIPLTRDATNAVAEAGVLSFANRGRQALMLRPRRDVNLLLPADSFGANLVRTLLELVAILALLIAFGVFLSATLSRPVALFVAFVILLLSEMSPSVVEQYPETLDTNLSDRIGLALTGFVAEVTHPISSLSPLSRLAKDECVEPADLAKVLLLDLVLVPLLLALLAGLALPCKQGDD